MSKISVIMGIYNVERTLALALDSLLNQTYKDFEVIMCDDGSNDGTLKIANQYREKYPEIFVLLQNEKNMGLNYTLNRCLERAQGEYIARMDGDDISVATRFEKEVQFLDKHPEYAIVSTEMIMFDEGGDWGKTEVLPYPEKSDFINHTPFFCHAACMIRKKAFMEVEGYTVSQKLLRVEDCHLWFKLYAKGYKGANIPEPLYKMRDDRNATKRKKMIDRFRCCYVMFEGFRLLGMPWYQYLTLVKVLLVQIVKGVMPIWVYEYYHKRKNR